MKKISYILFSLIVLFSAGCQHNDIMKADEEQSEVKGEVRVRFSTDIPEYKTVTTRANGGVDDMYLLVFDDNGNFIARRQATLSNQTTSSGKFEATLPSSTNPRTVHFISNFDWTGLNDNMIMGANEASVVALLNTTDHVFWARHELANGISETSFNGVTIPMLRNFAKITVENSATGFVYEGFTIHKSPTSGTVAPFNTTTAQFAEHSVIEPLGLTLADAQVGNISIGEKYLFERKNKSASTITTVIVKGKFQGGSSTYYKIDLIDANRVRYDLERNHHFKVIIENVQKDGFSNFNDALQGASHNNTILDPVIEKYPIISDGTSKLEVEKTLVILNNSGQDMSVWVKYFPNASSSTVNNSGLNVSLVDNDGGALVDGSLSFNPSTGVITATASSSIPGNIGTALIMVSQGELARTIRVILQPPYSFSPITINNANPAYLNNAQNTNASLRFTIPSDVPEELFPLPINIYTNGLYPASSGLQMFVEQGVIRYVYTATSTGVQTVGFKTNNTGVGEIVSLNANYFEDGSVSYSTSGVSYFGTIRYGGTNVPANANVSSSHGTISVTSPGNYSFVPPTSGANNTQVTITYDMVSGGYTERYQATTTLGALKTTGTALNLTMKEYVFKGDVKYRGGFLGGYIDVPNNATVSVSQLITGSTFVVSPAGKYTFTIPASSSPNMNANRTFSYTTTGLGGRTYSVSRSLNDLKTNPNLNLN